LRERYSPQNVVRRLQYHVPGWLEQLPQVPDALFSQLQSGRHAPVNRHADTGAARRQRQRAATRRRRHMAGAACAAGALLAVPALQATLSALPPTSWVLLAVAAFLLWPRTQED
ncbi:MAG: ubiquinone biosynthesis regulatory protein kinase UbiB, partial [Chromatocurvus sp.]